MAAFAIDISEQGAIRRFKIKGDINEKADFAKILAGKAPVMILDFKQVTSINSIGIRCWRLMLKDLAGQTIYYENCPTTVIDQINMIPELGKGIVVKSFDLPFTCSSCNIDTTHFLTREQALAPGFIDAIDEQIPCPKCERKLEFADDKEMYFVFLKGA